MLGATATPGTLVLAAPKTVTLTASVAKTPVDLYYEKLRSIDAKFKAIKSHCGTATPQAEVRLPPSRMDVRYAQANLTKRETSGWLAAWATYNVDGASIDSERCLMFNANYFSACKELVVLYTQLLSSASLRAEIRAAGGFVPSEYNICHDIMVAISNGLWATNIQPWLLLRMRAQLKMPLRATGVTPVVPPVLLAHMVVNGDTRPLVGALAASSWPAYGLGQSIVDDVTYDPLSYSTQWRYDASGNMNAADLATVVSLTNQWSTWFQSLSFEQLIGDALLDWLANPCQNCYGGWTSERIPVSQPDYAALHAQIKTLNIAMALSAYAGVIQATIGVIRGDIQSVVENAITVAKYATLGRQATAFDYVFIIEPPLLRFAANPAYAVDVSQGDTATMMEKAVGGMLKSLDATGFSYISRRIRDFVGQKVPDKTKIASTQSSAVASQFVSQITAGAGGKKNSPLVPILVGGGLLLVGIFVVKKIL